MAWCPCPVIVLARMLIERKTMNSQQDVSRANEMYQVPVCAKMTKE